LYDNVLVALDAPRRLNNGEPAALARWLDTLDLAPGERLLHVGCGVGYYTAIGAEAVSRDGSVLGVEIDPELAERARRNLAPYANPPGPLGRADGELGHAERCNPWRGRAPSSDFIAGELASSLHSDRHGVHVRGAPVARRPRASGRLLHGF